LITIKNLVKRYENLTVVDNLNLTIEGAMRQRDLLSDAEWRTYIQWMRNAFQRGTISERWKQIEEDRYLDPDFQNFINTEVLGASGICT
jgi:hypothetical protein